MSESTAQSSQKQVHFDSIVWNWTKHLLALYVPILAFSFLITAPHPWYIAILFMLPLVLAHYLDSNGKQELHAPNPDFPDWPFNLIMFMAAGLQFVNIFLLVSVFSELSVFRLDTLLAILFVGASSGYSGITLAHEFIHRRSPLYRQIGRALLVTTLYEHFYTEHLRGHHVRVATEADPATAKYDQNFWPFYFKTVPAQFKSAWKLEQKRIGLEASDIFSKKIINNYVFQGVLAQVLLMLLIYVAFGVFPLVLFILQAVFASRLLEIVNYFEHWGLTRAHGRVQPEDSWDTHSWFTYYGLVGLTRHADHHANPTRPYQHLRVFEESPVLPGGYITMVAMVMLNNKKFKQLMTEELERKKLGPFREAKPA